MDEYCTLQERTGRNGLASRRIEGHDTREKDVP